ncbi:hypothetical protein Tco_0846030 [Tanacetum coccineum]
MHGVQVQLVMGELRTMQIQVKQDRLSATTATENGVALDEEQLLFITRGQDNAVDEDVDEQPVQDLALNVDNVLQANDCDAFDSDVDEAPSAHTMFMANLSSSNPVYDEASPSYDSDILFEVHDHDHYQDTICEHHEVHEMHDDVQPNYSVDLHADYMRDCNMIPYNQYVKDNAVTIVQSNESFVPNDAYMMILNDIYELSAQCVSVPTQNNVVDNSLTAELVTYKKQVELYERRAKFELTEREQKINEQLRIGERGFEQTKECYLTEVIPFFKTLKEHFEGIQKALTKEIKEMKEIFEELEAEVDQNVVNRKHDEIERKNLLIANDNLIANCLSKEVFYIATNSELTVSRFTEMHAAHTVVQARCLELEAELSKLLDKVQKDDHTELVKRFSILENLKAQIHENLKCITMDYVKPRVLSPGRYAIHVEPIPPRNRNNREVHLDYLKHLKESVEIVCEIVEEAKVERPLDSSLASACLYTKHSQELKKQVTFKDQCVMSNSNIHTNVAQLNIHKTNFPVPPSIGVNSYTNASGSQPKSNTKKNRILPAKSVNKKKVKEHPRTNKSSLKTTNHIDSSISSKRTAINSNSHSVCKTCNKCLISANHDMCVVNYLHSVNASPSVKNVVPKVQQVWKLKQVKQVWKPTGKILTNVGYQWMPTGRTFTLGE